MASSLTQPSDGDVNIAYKLEIGATVTFVAAALVVGLRFVARIMYARLGWDDYIMIFAALQALVATVIDYVATHWGLGRHAYYLNSEQLVNQQFYSSLAQVFCIYALTFAKISICLTYLRVISGVHKRSLTWLRWVCYVVASSVFVVNSIVVITIYAQCMPAEKSWNRAVPGTCWSALTTIGFVLLQGSFSAVTDFVLCVVPVFLFKDLQVGVRSKAILCGLMGLGLITGVFAIIRTVKSSESIKHPSADASFNSILGLTWAGMERNIAIMIGSIPSLRPLASLAMKQSSRIFSRRTSSKSSTELKPGQSDHKSTGGKSKSQNGFDEVSPSDAIRDLSVISWWQRDAAGRHPSEVSTIKGSRQKLSTDTFEAV